MATSPLNFGAWKTGESGAVNILCHLFSTAVYFGYLPGDGIDLDVIGSDLLAGPSAHTTGATAAEALQEMRQTA